MLGSIGEANLLTLGTYLSAIALATEEAHFRHLRHFRTLSPKALSSITPGTVISSVVLTTQHESGHWQRPPRPGGYRIYLL